MRPEQVWPRVFYLAERAERRCGCSGILEAAVGVVAWLKLSLKLYHARELRRVYQQLMTEALGGERRGDTDVAWRFGFRRFSFGPCLWRFVAWMTLKLQSKMLELGRGVHSGNIPTLSHPENASCTDACRDTSITTPSMSTLLALQGFPARLLSVSFDGTLSVR